MTGRERERQSLAARRASSWPPHCSLTVGRCHPGSDTQGGVRMSKIEKSIDVNVPARIAYDQWTQFEEFPSFMEGVESVTQIDDSHLHWRANIGGTIEEWDAEITEQIPDKRIAWRSTRSTAPNA